LKKNDSHFEKKKIQRHSLFKNFSNDKNEVIIEIFNSINQSKQTKDKRKKEGSSNQNEISLTHVEIIFFLSRQNFKKHERLQKSGIPLKKGQAKTLRHEIKKKKESKKKITKIKKIIIKQSLCSHFLHY